ncbi:MAG: imidazoleglycerol-phosphate dehydratase [Methanothrix sp.]|nr:imidazoleglycerol-phosphate dehydratase [Methanothrix sp.]
MRASGRRETEETSIEIELETDGAGRAAVETGIQMLDEILLQFAAGGGFDLEVRARGDLETGDHHTTEDVAITLGGLLRQAIGGGTGSAIVPSGGCLATAAVRFGRPGYRGEFSFRGAVSGGMCLENFGHWLRSLAYSGGFTLHVRADGGDDRSKIEAMSFALGRALKVASKDPAAIPFRP